MPLFAEKNQKPTEASNQEKRACVMSIASIQPVSSRFPSKK